MASRTKIYKVRKKLKLRKAARARKNETAKVGTTPTKEAFFSAPS